MLILGAGLTASDRAARRLGICASDVAALVLPNGDAYGCPNDVFDSKTEPDKEEVLPLDDPRVVGQVYEKTAIEYACQMYGLCVSPKPPTLVHPEHDWARATPDGIVWDRDDNDLAGFIGIAPGEFMRRGTEVAVLDAKWITNAVSAREFGEPGTDQVPLSYGLQSLWQQHVCGLALGCVVASMFGRAPQVYWVERDDEVIGDLVVVARAFWFDHVLKGVAPPPDGSNAAERRLRRRFPRSVDMTVRPALPPEADAVWRYIDARTREDKAAQDKALAAQQIKTAVGPNLGIRCEDGSVAKWKGSNGERRLTVREPRDWGARAAQKE